MLQLVSGEYDYADDASGCVRDDLILILNRLMAIKRHSWFLLILSGGFGALTSLCCDPNSNCI